MIEQRINILFFLGIGILSLIVCRVIHLQVIRSNDYARKAFHSHFRKVSIQPRRGAVYDCRNRLLAASLASDSLWADPVRIVNPAETAAAICHVLNTDEGRIKERLSNTDRRFVWIDRGLTPGQASAIRSLDIPGLFFRKESRRIYPSHELFSSVIGFTGVDSEGLDGLEATQNTALSGTPGVELKAFDALSRPYSKDSYILKNPVQGEDLHLTIDKSIQHFASLAVKEMLKAEDADWGAAVVLNIETGEILALASEPSFNPYHYSDYNTEFYRNRCIFQLIEPGSTLKAVTLAAALETSTVELEDSFDCQGGQITIGPNTFNDWKSFSDLTAEDILVFSSNVGTIKMALKAGGQNLYDWCKKLGFGTVSLQELPGSTPGYVRSSKSWSDTETASLSIGYGIAVTPLQLATAYATFGNKGILNQPSLIKGHSHPGRQVLKKETADQIKKVLSEAVSRGTGKLASPPGFEAGGKTGTARYYDHSKAAYDSNKVTCVFAGIAPVHNPKISVAVVISNPQKHKWASKVSATVFARITSQTLYYLGEIPEGKVAA